jgi:alpha-D-xyloside xylohydrolase
MNSVWKRWQFSVLLFAFLSTGCGVSDEDTPQPTHDVELPGEDAEPSGDTVASQDVRGATDMMESVAPTELWAGEDSRMFLGEDDVFLWQRNEMTLLRFPLSGLQLGVVEEVDPNLNYDPYFLEPGVYGQAFGTTPDDLQWRSPTSVEFVSLSETEVEARLDYGDLGEGSIRFSSPDSDRVQLHWQAPSGAKPVVYLRLRFHGDETEGFYGLGEVFDSVEHRGQARPMHFEASNLESGYNEIHVPIPLLIGTTGWGVFVESYRLGVFAMAREEDDLIQVTFGLGEEIGEGLTFHLMSADHGLDITRHYYEITGYPGPVAPWALGPWIWRDEVEGQEAVEADLQLIRELDFANTGYWIDRPYATDVNSFDFHPEHYADPPGMMKVASDLGFAMALWHTPYVDPDGAISGALYQEAEEAGYFAPEMATATDKWGPPLDYTNPDASAWWQEQLSYYTDLGFEGYKLDYAEEVIPGIFGIRFPWLFFDGSDDRTMHRLYQLHYHKAYAETLPKEGGFLLCRAGGYGDQIYGSIIWPGDIDATMSKTGEEVTKEDGRTYNSVGGLPAAVIAGSSLGPSGFPLFASDTGGYRNAPTDKETFMRWFAHTALTPVMQLGTNANDLPWSFGKEKVFDQEVVDAYRIFARLHLRLFPYIWTYLKQVQQDGRAIQRPLGLAHPELGVHPDDTYLLGDDLLVAPVVDAGTTSRTHWLPGGDWHSWWTGESISGGESIEVEVPLDSIPFYVKAGALIPLLRPTIDTLRPVADPEAIDSFATSSGPLYVLMTPGAASERSLYDGTVISQEETEGILSLGREKGTVFGDAVVFEIMAWGTEIPSLVESDGETLDAVEEGKVLSDVASGWVWSEERGGTLWIKLSAERSGVQISL